MSWGPGRPCPIMRDMLRFMALRSRLATVSFVAGLTGCFVGFSPLALAQTEPVVGIRKRPSRVHALQGARVVLAPGRVLETGTVVVRDGRIVDVGPAVVPPADAQIHDCSGLTL